MDYLKGFETERLIIRKLTRRDTPVWAHFFHDTASFEFIGLENDKTPCEHSEKWMARQFRRYRRKEYGLMALVEKESMKLVGQCGLITMNVENSRELEIGYHIIPEFRGRGYAGEAARAMMNYAFESNLADTVITVIHVNNAVSQRLSLGMGLKRVKEMTCMNQPSWLYRITRSEWENLR